MDKVLHNSQSLEYRSPFGAMPTGEKLRLAIAVSTQFSVNKVWLNIWPEGGDGQNREMTITENKDGFNWFTVDIEPFSKSGLFWYNFSLDTGKGTIYYGNNQRQLGGKGQIYENNPASYQITVYDRDFTTPEWFKGAIVYQLMVDRFAKESMDAPPHNPKPGSLYHTDWYDSPAYLRDCPTNRVVAYDYFGGTLRGLINRLGYLKELNVEAIYLNPIFEAHSNHKYDTADYHKLDSSLGSDEDFAELVTIAKRVGIRLILDGVFNHTGADSRYFNAFGRYPELGAAQSTESSYYSWYNFEHYPDKYECWWGNDNLPNVNELTPSYREFIIDDEDSVVKHWLRKGTGGWRLDVVDELPDEFVQDLRKAAKSVDPDAVIMGEVWEDASHKSAYGFMKQYLQGGELDTVMNYPFRRAVIDFFLGKSSTRDVHDILMSLYENYPHEVFYANLNLLGSHDRPRVLSLLAEVLHEDSDERLFTLADYQRLAPEARILGCRRLKLAALWQMSFPGSPCIYYADEAGQDGGKDPCNRRTYPWQREDKELLSYYKKITAMRRKYPVLKNGDWQFMDSGSDDVLVIRRYYKEQPDVATNIDDNVAFCIINRDPFHYRELDIDLSAENATEWRDVLAANKLVPTNQGRLQIQLAPLSGMLLLKKIKRYSGVLLHPTSLPGPYGIGDAGSIARGFIDWLAAAKQSYWQILPHNPVGYGESPYQGTSAFAGNPMFISPDELVSDGLLTKKEINDVKKNYKFSDSRVMFAPAKELKEKLLRIAFANFSKKVSPELKGAFDSFCVDNEEWLSDYAMFMALKRNFGGNAWTEWPSDIRDRDKVAMDKYRRNLASEVRYERFLQFIFDRQWQNLRQYASKKGIKIIGDLPLFVAPDSADAWANREMFELNSNGTPRLIAGCPPDAFAVEGQRWGNPQYNWGAMAADGYKWWQQRMFMLSKLVDVVRIDHFRGLDAYWEIPATEKTAVNGRWVKGPADELLTAITEAVPGLEIIAENLGFITDSVTELKNRFALPGMLILQFELEGGVDATGGYGVNEVVYTGTHDNETIKAWYERQGQENPRLIERIKHDMGIAEKISSEEFCWKIIEFGMATDSDWFVVPMQDLLTLGSDARMNRPGFMGGNWEWRCIKKSFSAELAEKIKKLADKYGRNL